VLTSVGKTDRGATSSGKSVGAASSQKRHAAVACQRLLRPESKMTIWRDGGRLGFETRRGKKNEEKSIAKVSSSKGGEGS
jgi:hypothetical protein